VSNVDLEQLEQLWAQARVRPRFVQNRCYAVRGWDRAVRRFCSANQIVYQGFSLLTANAQFFRHPWLLNLAHRLGRTPAQIVFRFSLDVGMLPLTGTTDPKHMAEDLATSTFRLEPQDVAELERIAEPGSH
jgi:diketogulonate reductase-like aldo/keto reductase